MHKTCSIGYASFPFLLNNPKLLSWERVIDIADHCLMRLKIPISNRNAWVGLENLALNDDNIMLSIIENTQQCIDANVLEVSSSLSDSSHIYWK